MLCWGQKKRCILALLTFFDHADEAAHVYEPLLLGFLVGLMDALRDNELQLAVPHRVSVVFGDAGLKGQQMLARDAVCFI